jgi:hypothetical protein
MTPEELARLAALEARVAALESNAGLDVPFLRQLLPALAGRFGSHPFTIGEARRDPGLRRIIGNRSAVSLGKLFARSAGFIVGGYELGNLGRHGSRALWSVWWHES